MNSSERANYLVRFVGTEMGKMKFEDGVEKLEEIISEYICVEGKMAGAGVIETEDLNEWKKTLDIYNKIGEVLFRLENKFPNCEEKIAGFFNLKMVGIFLSSVVIKGSKKFKNIEEKQTVKLNRGKLIAEDKQLREEHFKLSEEFIRNPIPFVNKNEVTKELQLNMTALNTEKDKFLEKGDIVFWYLAYYRAIVERQKEIHEKGKNNQDFQEAEDKLKTIADEYIQYARSRNLDSRVR